MNFKFNVTPLLKGKYKLIDQMWELTAALLVVYCFGAVKASLMGPEYFFNTLALLVFALLGSVGAEVVYAKSIKKSIKEFVLSSYGWITALITVLIVPADTSLYAIFMANVIATFFGKLAFGGFGQNVFNPAAIAKAIIGTSFVSKAAVDLIASATPASRFKTVSWIMDKASFGDFLAEFGGLKGLLLGSYHGAIGETFSLLIIVIAVVLIVDKIIDWVIPATYIGFCFVAALIVGATHGLGLSYALAFVLSGGLVFGAVFMLTEPVTSPISKPGKIMMAVLAGFITCLIRFKGNMSEGVVYAVLIVNMLTAVVDKVFYGNLKKNQKKNNTINAILVAVCVACVVAIAAPIKAGSYVPLAEESSRPAYAMKVDNALKQMFEGEQLTEISYTDSEGIITKAYKCNSGYVFETATAGFEGNIVKLVIGVDNSGAVKNVICTRSVETEGIGSNIFTTDYLAENVIGKTASDEIELYATATFTSSAVKTAVNRALAVFMEVK